MRILAIDKYEEPIVKEIKSRDEMLSELKELDENLPTEAREEIA